MSTWYEWFKSFIYDVTIPMDLKDIITQEAHTHKSQEEPEATDTLKEHIQPSPDNSKFDDQEHTYNTRQRKKIEHAKLEDFFKKIDKGNPTRYKKKYGGD